MASEEKGLQDMRFKAAKSRQIDRPHFRRYTEKSMFGMSLSHIMIIAIVVLVVGPQRLPELARSLGKAMRNFRDSLDGVKEPEFRRMEAPPQANATQQSEPNTVSSQAKTDPPQA